MLTSKEQQELIKLVNSEFLTSENVLKSLDFLGVNYSVIDSNGNYIIQNGTMVKNISNHLTNAELIDKESWENCKKVMQSGEIEVKEEPFKDAWFLSIKKPLIKNGKTLGIVVLSANITDRKKTEELLHEKEMLEAKVKTTILLSRSISHEIRNALAGISINTDITLDAATKVKNLIDEKNDKLNQAIDQVIESTFELKKAVKNGTYTVETLTTNTRETEIDKSSFSHYAMKKNIEETLKEYPFVDQQKDQVILSGEDFMYFGSKFHIKQVLSNLIRNAFWAFTFAPDKKGKLKITLVKEKNSSSVIIEDNGCGIAKETRDNLFAPFTSTKKSGIGLGLSFCKLVMAAHNGSITCESVSAEEDPKNSFTRFILKFPLQS